MMRRTPLVRSKPLRPSRPAPESRPERPVLVPSAIAPRADVRMATRADLAQPAAPVEKDNAVRSEPYLRLVASYPCLLCFREGRSQAAHCNALGGKAGGLKADDRFTFALCADEPGRTGCHRWFDQSGVLAKHARPLIELNLVTEQVRLIVRDNRWPRNLPMVDLARVRERLQDDIEEARQV